MIYPSRSVESRNVAGYEELLASGLVQRIFLDELPELETLDDSAALFKLLVEPKKTVLKSAKSLLKRLPEQTDFIQQILFRKFSNLTQKEILKMLSIEEEFEEELKKTRAYKEILAEGKLVGIEQGIKEGIKEGVKEGELKGKLEAVPFLRELGVADKKLPSV